MEALIKPLFSELEESSSNILQALISFGVFVGSTNILIISGTPFPSTAVNIRASQFSEYGPFIVMELCCSMITRVDVPGKFLAASYNSAAAAAVLLMLIVKRLGTT